MIKKLNEGAMQSELSGSAFFQLEPAPAALLEAEPAGKTTTLSPAAPAGATAVRHATTPPRAPATAPSRRERENVVEAIRKAVKQLGKEEATYRLTAPEKKMLADLVYSYAGLGIKTSQNEITRIGVNYLLEDYGQNGQQSVLARVLERLNE
jgi:hypothetical protein